MDENKTKKNKKRILITIILIIISLVLVFVLIYFFAPYWLVNQLFVLNGGLFKRPNSLMVPIPTDWKTYTNYENGVEIRYPNNWSFWEQSDGSTYHADFAGPQGEIIRADFDCSYVIGGTEEERSMVKIDRQQFGGNVFVRHILSNDFNQDGKQELIVHAYSTPYPEEYISSGRFGECKLLTFIIRSPISDENILETILSSIKFIGFDNSTSVLLWDTYQNKNFGFSMELPYEWRAYNPVDYSVLAYRPFQFPNSEKIYTGPERSVFFISLRYGDIPDYSQRASALEEVGHFYNVSDKDGVLLSDGQTLLFLLELPNKKYMSIRTFSKYEPVLRQIVKTIIIPEFDIRDRSL